MSSDLWSDPATGLALSTYAGPAEPADIPRTRLQITTVAGGFVGLTMPEWNALCRAVRELHRDYPSLVGQLMPSGAAWFGPGWAVSKGDDRG